MKERLKLTSTELLHKEKNKTKRYPNLQTVLMVEAFLKNNRDLPLKISEIKNKLPKQIMHQTLAVILEYLWRSGKIIYGPRGVQWIFAERKELERLIAQGTEV